MGKSYSKQEEKEVIITQNAAGSNEGQGIAEHAEHLHVNNVLLTSILVIIAVAVLIFAFYKYKKCHHKWIQKEIRGDMARRIRVRLSGRSRKQPGEDGTRTTDVGIDEL
jgi:hypothetical protein